jgi:hypothetical protein
MASTPQPIAAVVLDSATTIYDPFVASGATRGMLIYLNFMNTGTADVTVDCYIDKATDIYILDDKTIPGKGNVEWSGCITMDTATDLLRAIASVTSVVHVTGTVVENA